MQKNYLLSISTLSGTIIGAGIFSLPFVFKTLGFGTSVIYLLVFALVYTFVHFMYARVLEKSQGQHQFFYLAKKYLPRSISRFASFVIFAELILVLVVYLVLAPVFINIAFGVSAGMAMFIFWGLGSILMFTSRGMTGILESLDTIIILLIVGLIISTSQVAHASFSALEPLFKTNSWAAFFIPFGPLLFSLSGRPGVAELVESFKNSDSKNKIFSAIAIGTFAPALLYILFVGTVLWISPGVGESTLESLTFLPGWLYRLLGVMGVVTLLTSYFVIARNVLGILKLDLKWSVTSAALLTACLPLALKLLAFQSFIGAVSFVGGIFLALESAFVVWMWQRVYRDSPWRKPAAIIYLVFICAAAYEVLKLANLVS